MLEKNPFPSESVAETREFNFDFDYPYMLQNQKSLEITRELLKNKMITERLDFLRSHHLPSYKHSVRVGVLSVDLSIANQLGEKEVEQIGAGGLLHDIGKCAIPIEILMKAAPLSEEERELIESHVRKGFEALKDPMFDGVREIVVAHHEFRVDGPYPRNGKDRRNDDRAKTKMDNAAIVAVADVFDALYVQRPYHPEFSREEIEQIIRQTYTGDPNLVDQVMERYQKKV